MFAFIEPRANNVCLVKFLPQVPCFVTAPNIGAIPTSSLIVFCSTLWAKRLVSLAETMNVDSKRTTQERNKTDISPHV